MKIDSPQLVGSIIGLTGYDSSNTAQQNLAGYNSGSTDSTGDNSGTTTDQGVPAPAPTSGSAPSGVPFADASSAPGDPQQATYDPNVGGFTGTSGSSGLGVYVFAQPALFQLDLYGHGNAEVYTGNGNGIVDSFGPDANNNIAPEAYSINGQFSDMTSPNSTGYFKVTPPAGMPDAEYAQAYQAAIQNFSTYYSGSISFSIFGSDCWSVILGAVNATGGTVNLSAANNNTGSGYTGFITGPAIIPPQYFQTPPAWATP